MRPDRDDPLAPAIRRTLQGSRTDCPEAETIAAYAERSLADAERRGVELHLSTCARCRETLLLMSRAAEADTPASSSPRFLLYRWPWLAGAAAAGLAVVVWLALPPADRARLNPIGSRRSHARSAGSRRLPSPNSPQRTRRLSRPTRRVRKRSPLLPASSSRGTVAAARSAGVRRKEAAGRRRPERNASSKRLASGAPASRRRPRLHKRCRPSHRRLRPPPRSPSGPSRRRPRRPRRASRIRATRDTASPQLMARTQQNIEYLMASGPPADARAVSAISAVTWRVSPSGIVERSADGGATWTRERGVDAPAARAIHAPSRDVCWIVGDRGLILRFDTGRGWTRLSPPAQVGFMAVEAPDALRATITAADGRRFTTTDGGQTWR